MAEAQGLVFTRADAQNVELVRQIILYRLKTDSTWNNLNARWHHLERYVRFDDAPRLEGRFFLLAGEVLWQLLAQGVISPGMDESNPNLPWFRITDYGQRVLQAERFIPHDPAGYLDDVRAAAKTTVGAVAIAYIEEGLRCFTAGCHTAAVLLLGVAAESVFLRMSAVVRASLRSQAEQSAFDNLPNNVRQKHRWIVDKYFRLPSAVRRERLPESLDITLTSLYELIRRQRNDLGHPQDSPPSVDRERAFVFFRLFPSYLSDVEAFVEYCQANEL